ncbi:2,3-bisphosphoglycerate-dependent phosphoglycerate mutase [bacterium]|nr:2,3-bisphosphoglycerate-dependent phosphoglycerate mutase [bacterium]
MAKLIVARHHESEWNKKGLWTGNRDSHLTEYGFKKSCEMGELIRDIHIDRAFASMQVRSIETLSCMLETLNLIHVPTVHSSSINERDYGDYTGKNKWEMQQLIGHEQWEKVRREWDCPVPNGETLKMVFARVVPFYEESILPLLKGGNNVLIVSHGNAIRALMKHLEHIPDEAVKDIEMLFGGILIYDIAEDGSVTHKEMRQVESDVHA